MIPKSGEPSDIADDFFAEILGLISSSSPETTWNGIQRLPKGRMRGLLEWQYGAALAQIDPVEAAEHLSAGQRLSKRDQTDYRQYFFAGIEKLPTKEAIDFVVNHFSRDPGGSMLSGILGKLALRDPGAALSALESVPFGELRENVISGIASSFSKIEPVGAVKWMRSLENDRERKVAARAITGFSTEADILPRLRTLYPIVADDKELSHSLIASAMVTAALQTSRNSLNPATILDFLDGLPQDQSLEAKSQASHRGW
ncbi:MAG: hypothetical protein KDN22_12130, partial [Verrucomicrobiae bacterium]|nr:hypothetical protein [Verrucomicrobiae bacterium]